MKTLVTGKEYGHEGMRDINTDHLQFYWNQNAIYQVVNENQWRCLVWAKISIEDVSCTIYAWEEVFNT
eukprot:11133648-Lingulodinium_polyedra.AAC.1